MNPSELYLRLRAAFWLLPVTCVLIAGAAAPIVAGVEEHYASTGGLWFSGGPTSAQQILSVVASSVLTFAGLVFSITIVALQLASSQFSPRVLRSFLRDRYTQLGLGTFVGTYTYALLTLREVRSSDASAGVFVPGAGVTIAVVLGLLSVGTLMLFIHHMAQSVRVVVVIDRIFHETRRALDRFYPDRPRSVTGHPLAPRAPGPRRVIESRGTGAIAYIDIEDLVEHAVVRDLTVELLAESGSFMIAGQPLLRVTGEGDLDAAHLRSLVGFESEREVGEDPPYGFRQLVDIAERAISPAVNDPTTAVQCIDRLHALLRRIATRPLAVGDHVVDGILRLRVPMASWADYLALACDELRHWGAGAPRIQRRLELMLLDLDGIVDDDRRSAVGRQLDLLRTSRRDQLPDHEWEAIVGPGDPAERPLPSELPRPSDR